MARLRKYVTFANVVSCLALFFAFTTGTAYAINEWTGANVVDGSLTGADIEGNSVHGNKLKNNTVLNAKLVDNTITGAKIADTGTIGSAEVGPLHGDLDIQDNTITTFDIATDAVDSDEVLDFGLSNQDVGVLFAQIDFDGTVANSSGGVTASHIGAGTYEVDFGRNVVSCAAVATQGEAGIGGAGGAIMGATDRAGNTEAFFVTSRTDANVLADRSFQLVVVC